MRNIVLIFLVGFLFTNLNAYNFFDNKVQIKTNVSASGYINQLVSILADQLSQNKDFKNISSTPIAIASIVDLKDYTKVGKIGHIISENLIHEMQVRGYRVVDFKSMPTLMVKPNGDYLFSRNLKDLKKEQNINYVIGGTYMYYSDGVSINCRLIDIRTNIVKSSAQIFIPASIVNRLQFNSGFDLYPDK